VLQGLIRDRLDCPCEVQVLNAGIEGYDPSDVLERLERLVLPLHPDLVISYQGYMAFGLTGLGFVPRGPLRIIPPTAVPPSPQRPSRLLGALEYRLRLACLEWTLPVVEGETYRALYERMIALADSAGVRLALANQTLAVTADSPSEVVAFYTQAFPRVDKRIRANNENTRLLCELATQHPGLTMIDTRADLDGAWDGKYIDLFHFTQWGRNTLAWNIFKGIEPLLAQAAGCRPRPGLAAVPPGVQADPTPAEDWELLRQWLAARRVTPATLSLELMGPSNCRGFTHVEGPYPQWEIPFRFRWVTAPEATIQLWSGAEDETGGRSFRLHLGSHATAQEVTLELDQRPWARLCWGPTAGWRELECAWPPLKPGEHTLTVRASQHVQYPGDPRQLFLMFGPMETDQATGQPGAVAAAPSSVDH
jgi:lysophospholipase L1-like esterase